MSHLENLKSLLQSCPAILEQFAHLTVTEEILECAAVLSGQ
jgi:hypothetical protein